MFLSKSSKGHTSKDWVLYQIVDVTKAYFDSHFIRFVEAIVCTKLKNDCLKEG